MGGEWDKKMDELISELVEGMRARRMLSAQLRVRSIDLKPEAVAILLKLETAPECVSGLADALQMTNASYLVKLLEERGLLSRTRTQDPRTHRLEPARSTAKSNGPWNGRSGRRLTMRFRL